MGFNEQQELAINTIDKNVLVSASAGSGKTTVMLERVLRILKQGVDIERIVMLSFNNDIASEMRGRLGDELLRSAAGGDISIENAQRQIDNIPFADISTFHGFCSKLIKRYAEVIGEATSFGILQGEEQEATFKKVTDAVFKKRLKSRDEMFLELKNIFDAKDEDGFFKIISKLYSFSLAQADREKWLGDISIRMYDNPQIAKDYFYKTFMGQSKNLLSATYEFTTLVRGDKTAIKILDDCLVLASVLEKIAVAKTLEEVFCVVENFAIPRKAVAGKSPYKDDYDELRAELKDCLSEIKGFVGKVLADEKTKQRVEKLCSVVEEVFQMYTLEKRKEGKLDFNDLEYYSVKILKNPSIVFELKSSFDFICVDEYQDTNELQEFIVQNIGKENNLFMVGDSKQSIYKFRLTEPKIILDKYKRYEQTGEGEAIGLNYNYRSRAEILDFCNLVFDELMTEDYGGLDYKAKARFKPKAEYDTVSSEPAVEYLQVLAQEKPQGFIPEVYSVEKDLSAESKEEFDRHARAIADKILSIVGKEDIYNAKTKERECIKFSDIILLTPTRSDKALSIIQTLQKLNIPVEGIKSEEINYEIKVLLDLLRVLDNPMQDIPLLAVMRSWFGKFSNNDIAEIRCASLDKKHFFESCFDYNNNDDISKRLKEFFEMLDKLREYSSFKSVKELLEVVCFEYGYFNYLSTQKDGQVLVKMVEGFLSGLGDKTYACGVTEFLYAYDKLKITDKSSSDAETLVDTVKTGTIHSSKGLEYPIVFLIDVDRGFNFQDEKIGFLLNKDYGVFISDFDKENLKEISSLQFEFAKAVKRKEDLEEKVRLLYVALTRAKNHLYIVGNEFSEKAKTRFDFKKYSDMFAYVARKNNDFFKHCKSVEIQDGEEENVLRQEIVGSLPTSSELVEKIKEYIKFPYASKESTTFAIKHTATGINRLENEQYEIVTPQMFEKEDAKRGTNYHKVMQYIDYGCASLSAVEDNVAELVEGGVLREDEIADLDMKVVLECLQSETIRYAVKNRHFREQEFLMYVKACEVTDTSVEDKILVQGAIDLIIMDDDGCVVVDFKKSNKSEEALVATYKKQLELYRRATEKALGLPVKETLLYILGKNKIIKI